MLHVLRRRAQSKIIQIMVILIAIVFIFWGVGNNFLNSRNAAAMVNDEEISFQDFQRAYDRAADGYREQFGGVVPDRFFEMINLKQQVLQQLIRGVLLRQGGEAMGIGIAAESTRKEIAAMAAFHEQGRFEISRYRQVLGQNRLSPAVFEAQLREDMLRTTALAAIQRFARLSDDEVTAFLRLADEEILLDTVTLTADAFVHTVQIGDEPLKAFYAERRDSYRPGPQIRLQYLFFAVADDLPAVEVTAEEIAARAQQPGAVGPQPDPAAELRRDKAMQLTMARAAAAYEEVIRSGSMAAYAEKWQAPLGETAFFDREHPPEPFMRDPRFLDSAFRLHSGELGLLSEIDAGYILPYAVELRQAEAPELEQVRERVQRDFVRQEARKLAQQAAAELLQQARSQGSLAGAAKAAGFTAVSSPPIRRDPASQNASGLPAALLRVCFPLAVSQPFPAEVVETGDSFHLAQLLQRRSQEQAGGDERREALREALLAERQDQLIGAWLTAAEGRARIRPNAQFLK